MLSDQADIVSRAEWVKKALASDLWKPLEADGANEVDAPRPSPLPDADKPALSGTDLDTPLAELLENASNLRAVVLFSDGDYNLGQPPVVAAQKLRLRGVPLFPIPVGSETRLPDLDLLSVTAPTYGIVGENVQIPFTIRSSLDRQVRTIVRLRDETGREQTKDIVIPPNAETYDSILWRLEKEGTSTLELSIPVADGELIAANNSPQVHHHRHARKRSACSSSRPCRAGNTASSATPSPATPASSSPACSSTPQLGPGDGIDYIEEFPEKLEDLAKYDVIFLGDVGIAQRPAHRGTMRAASAAWSKTRPSGVVFLPGPQGNQCPCSTPSSATSSRSSSTRTSPSGIAESIASPLTLTTEGRGSLLTMLGDTEEENPRHLAQPARLLLARPGDQGQGRHRGARRPRQPPQQASAPSRSSSPARRQRQGALHGHRLRLALAPRRRGPLSLPLLGPGRPLDVLPAQHGRRPARPPLLHPERPDPGDTVTLNANAFDPNGAPLEEGTVTIDLTAPDGTHPAHRAPEERQPPGAPSAAASRSTCPAHGNSAPRRRRAEDKPLETTLLAQGVELEKTGQPARPEVLEEMARVSRGRIIQPDQLADLVREITRPARTPPARIPHPALVPLGHRRRPRRPARHLLDRPQAQRRRSDPPSAPPLRPPGLPPAARGQ